MLEIRIKNQIKMVCDCSIISCSSNSESLTATQGAYSSSTTSSDFELHCPQCLVDKLTTRHCGQAEAASRKRKNLLQFHSLKKNFLRINYLHITKECRNRTMGKQDRTMCVSLLRRGLGTTIPSTHWFHNEISSNVICHDSHVITVHALELYSLRVLHCLMHSRSL